MYLDVLVGFRQKRYEIRVNLGLIFNFSFIQQRPELETHGFDIKRKSIEDGRHLQKMHQQVIFAALCCAGYVGKQSLHFWFLCSKLNFNALLAEKLHLKGKSAESNLQKELELIFG